MCLCVPPGLNVPSVVEVHACMGTFSCMLHCYGPVTCNVCGGARRWFESACILVSCTGAGSDARKPGAFAHTHGRSRTPTTHPHIFSSRDEFLKRTHTHARTYAHTPTILLTPTERLVRRRQGVRESAEGNRECGACLHGGEARTLVHTHIGARARIHTE